MSRPVWEETTPFPPTTTGLQAPVVWWCLRWYHLRGLLEKGQLLLQLVQAPAGQMVHSGHWRTRERQTVRTGEMGREIGTLRGSEREGVLEGQKEPERGGDRGSLRPQWGPGWPPARGWGPWGCGWPPSEARLPTLPAHLCYPTATSPKVTPHHARLRCHSEKAQGHASWLGRRERPWAGTLT